ncbi:MAG: hypothetical protein ABJA57_01540 [Ginsengibacter sp.]
MEEKKFSEEDSLQLITQMINQAKNYYYESGLGALLWGFTNVICFLLAYIDAVPGGISLPFNPFFLMIITFVLQFYYDRKEAKFRHAKSYLDEVHKYVWMAFGVSVLILTIGGGIANIGYMVLPMLLLLFGMPTVISGCIMKFSPFIIGGVICWILCVVAFFYKSYDTYLLVAAGSVAAWVIPGFILRARFKKNLVKYQHGV